MIISKPKKLDLKKILLSSLAVCAATAAMLYLYAKPIQDLLVKLEEIKNMENMIWFVENVPLFFSMTVPAVLLMALYADPQYYRPVYSQKEQFYISLAVMCFTYLVMLPYVLLTGTPDVAESSAPVRTLWDITYKWFFMQSVPQILMIAYHSVRAGSEAAEPAEKGADEK